MPKEIEIIISEDWKYEYYRQVQKISRCRDEKCFELSKHIIGIRTEETWTGYNEDTAKTGR